MSDEALVNLLLSNQPSAVALVGKPVFRLAQAVNKRGALNSVPDVSECEQLDDFARLCEHAGHAANDWVMCLDLPDDADYPEQVLGLGCRLSPNLLLVEHSQRSVDAKLLGDEQFFAHGFRLFDKTTDNLGLQRHRYVFSLSDYKQSPDWLNARFWAHPERFNVLD